MNNKSKDRFGQIIARFLIIFFGPAFVILIAVEVLNYLTEPYWVPFK